MARYHRVECDKCRNPIQDGETRWRVIISRDLQSAGVAIDLCQTCYEDTRLKELEHGL